MFARKGMKNRGIDSIEISFTVLLIIALSLTLILRTWFKIIVYPLRFVSCSFSVLLCCCAVVLCWLVFSLGLLLGLWLSGELSEVPSPAPYPVVCTVGTTTYPPKPGYLQSEHLATTS